MSVSERARVVELPGDARRGRAAAALASLRAHQWTKNLLLFAGIIFAAKIGDWVRWVDAVAAFAAYCAASSAGYILNDLRDAERDRVHPVKRRRPIARGEISTLEAGVLASVLAGVSIALAATLGVSSLVFLCCFLAMQAAYSLGLKDIVLIDVMTISTLFVVRAAAGADAVDVRISPWLLLCTALLALFLGLAKRRSELLVGDAQAPPGRPVLEGYSVGLVDQLVTIVAAATVVAYSLYTFTARESSAMMMTIPFVVFGVFRYLLLMHRRELGEEPERVFVSDRPILVAVAAWAAMSATILAVVDS